MVVNCLCHERVPVFEVFQHEIWVSGGCVSCKLGIHTTQVLLSRCDEQPAYGLGSGSVGVLSMSVCFVLDTILWRSSLLGGRERGLMRVMRWYMYRSNKGMPWNVSHSGMAGNNDN